MHQVRKEIRVVGWDDTRHTRATKTVTLVGPIFRGGQFMDGLLSTNAEVDGSDATDKIARAIVTSHHYDQLSVIMTDGITFGGFNIVDIRRLNALTQLPVIAIQRKRPDVKEFVGAIKKVFKKDWRKRIAIVKRTGTVVRFKRNGKEFYYQRAGVTKKRAEEILDVCTVRGNVPEPIRAAHLIASGLSGESRGRA